MSDLKRRLKNLLQTVKEFEEDDFTENDDINLIEEDLELYETIKGIGALSLPKKEYFKRLAKYEHLYANAAILYENLKHIKIEKRSKAHGKKTKKL